MKKNTTIIEIIDAEVHVNNGTSTRIVEARLTSIIMPHAKKLASTRYVLSSTKTGSMALIFKHGQTFSNMAPWECDVAYLSWLTELVLERDFSNNEFVQKKTFNTVFSSIVGGYMKVPFSCL